MVRKIEVFGYEFRELKWTSVILPKLKKTDICRYLVGPRAIVSVWLCANKKNNFLDILTQLVESMSRGLTLNNILMKTYQD